MNKFNYYKNMIMTGVIIALLVGGGTGLYMKYRSLVDTIDTLTTEVGGKVKEIKELNDRLNTEKGNYAKIKDDLRIQNEANLAKEMELNSSREAYSELLLMTTEDRYGKDSNMTKILKGDMDLHNIIRTISGVKYEDL